MAKKKTILDLIEMKEKEEKAAWMVLYDSCFASYAEEAGMDMILVSLHGYDRLIRKFLVWLFGDASVSTSDH